MKNYLQFLKLIILFLFISPFAANATIINITVQDFMFSPSNVNAFTGDTVRWTWVNGIHTTTSLSVPPGAAMWDNPIQSSNPTFMYKITHPGAHTYKCTPHFAAGMTGQINASIPIGMQLSSNTASGFQVLSNPVGQEFNLSLSGLSGHDVSIEIMDALGRNIYSGIEKSESDLHRFNIPCATLRNGMYFVSAITANRQKWTFKVIKN